MKHISFSLSDKKEYKKAVKKSIAKSHRSQLIQIFTSQTNKRKIKTLLQKINKDFPSALVIGTTTAGEISHAKMYDNSTIISLTIFKETQEFISLHSHNEKHFIEKLSPDFFDSNVVYASDAGMPGVSDPGAILVSYCIKNGLEYDILPGANAVLSAFVASGFVKTQMLFLGFLDHKGSSRNAGLLKALYSGYTTVL